MSIWFTSDTHFSHANIIEYSKRPFKTVEEMDDTIINNWNAVIGSKDVVWHLGDFAWWRDGLATQYRRRLNGIIHLCWGNHDKNKKEIAPLFASVQDVAYIKWNKDKFFLSHYAHRTWRGSHRGSYMCFGHSHGDLPNYGRSMDVGVDPMHFKPISIEEVVRRLENFEPTSHHKNREEL